MWILKLAAGLLKWLISFREDENRRLQAGIARIRRLERNDDPDLRGLRIRALGVSDAETLLKGHREE